MATVSLKLSARFSTIQKNAVTKNVTEEIVQKDILEDVSTIETKDANLMVNGPSNTLK